MYTRSHRNRFGFLELPAEIRNNIYELYLAGIKPVIKPTTATGPEGARSTSKISNKQLYKAVNIYSGKAVVFDETGHVSQGFKRGSQHLVALLGTCRQIAREGRDILFSKERINFQTAQDFTSSCLGKKTLLNLDRLSSDFEVKSILFSRITKLHVNLAASTVYRTHRDDPAARSTVIMLHILHTSMPMLKHLELTMIPSSESISAHVLPVSWMLRGLFRLRGISTFGMWYVGYRDYTKFYEGGDTGNYEFGMLRAFQEVLELQYEAVNNGEAGIEFPGGLLDCSAKDIHLTVGKAVIERLDIIMSWIDVNEDPDDPRDDDEEQEEFTYYYNMYRDLQEDMEELDDGSEDLDDHNDDMEVEV